MKRFFKCKFVRNDEMVVAVETSQTGDIANRVEIPDEVGNNFFGREQWGNMVFDDLDEITKQEALDWTISGRLDDIPVAILAEDEQPQSETHKSDGIALTEAEADFLEELKNMGDKNVEQGGVENDAKGEAITHHKRFRVKLMSEMLYTITAESGDEAEQIARSMLHQLFRYGEDDEWRCEIEELPQTTISEADFLEQLREEEQP